jgi:hypothetical protein
MQALNQWQHPVASSEAPDMLYWSMRPASYRCIAMAIEIAIDSPWSMNSLKQHKTITKHNF